MEGIGNGILIRDKLILRGLISWFLWGKA
ncbi:hypothetical protein Gotur_020341 [Gossypium turneri]